MIINHKRCYKRSRCAAYPPIGDQLDAVYKLAKALEGVVELPPEVQSWVDEITSIKATFKKD